MIKRRYGGGSYEGSLEKVKLRVALALLVVIEEEKKNEKNKKELSFVAGM